MKMRRGAGIVLAAVGFHLGSGLDARAQCCFNDLFAGCGACFRKPPVYAVAPVAAPVMAPMMAPMVAPVAAPPPPVMVPVQQTSYVPETTYRTQYQNVAVTTYKPSSEIDPCTGCPRECMEPVTQYVQQAVNVPVTQYRAVTTTKYVQMQPGYAGGAYPAAQPAMAAPAMAPAPAATPFAAPVQTSPQGWGAAGADIPPQLVPGSAPPAMPPAGVPQQTYQQPSYQQPITPQSGIAMPAAPQAGIQPQPMQQPATLTPTPSLKPIPELPRTSAPAASSPPSGQAAGSSSQTYAPAGQTYAPSAPSPGIPSPSGTNGANGTSGTNGFPAPPAINGSGTSGGSGGLQPAPTAAPPGMPVLPGQGPKASTNAFPRLLEPTSHTTSWQPAMLDGSPRGRQPGYPTAALPARLQQ